MVQCLAVERIIEQSMCVAKMRMLRWMSGTKRKDRTRNEYVIGIISVALIVDKMKENTLR